MGNVLLLGAGLVSRPLARYLLDVPGVKLTVASRTVSKAEALIEGHPQGVALQLNVKDTDKVNELVMASDVVISLLPWTMHVQVAKMCLTHKKHMVTTSYVSEGMRALDAEVKEAGLLFLNEIGVDPGIDHMSAMQIIDDVKARGGQVTSFYSLCGGLPAPKDNDNPFGYKFSWSPRGVVLAGRNDARYLKDGEELFIPGKELFASYEVRPVMGLSELEAYPNRNSVPYVEIYGLQGIKTLMRGTYRNLGWCDTLLAIASLGILDDTARPEWEGKTYADVMRSLIGVEGKDVRAAVCAFLKDVSDDVLDRLEWLGMFSDRVVESKDLNALDILCERMMATMAFTEGQVDMVAMQHEFEVEFPDHKERITSTMIQFGEVGGDSAMASTVGLPAAIATRMLLAGELKATGVVIPTDKVVYEPVMAELAELGITFEEKVERV